MIATPSTYQFGQQIIIPDRGIGEVHDRGGAIVQAGERGYEHDRIDIWMGHGEVGLIRALIRGKRTIDIYVCDSDTYEEDKIGFDLSSLSANT
jgi:3D (Asp-Asp-Asp) domain-containing protein